VQETDGERPAGAPAAAAEAASRARAEAGTLYVVATPLGNLRDITLRALDILASADVIAAEDTRVTTTLLRHFGIATRPLSLHEHNEARRVARVLAELRTARSVALVTDAGTPAISDPGARLARAVRAAGFRVVPVPGANAAIAAICAAGLEAQRFLFLGFLPTRGGDRRALLAAVAPLPCALAIYEAPHRVRATVAALAEVLGGERELVVARELTKKFETITRMPLGEAPAWFAADANRERGEFVLLVDVAESPAVQAGTAVLAPEAERWLAALLDELPPARAARVVAAVSGQSRDLVYARALALKR
jgi:16S rRNA (cytidine1402-2'-O)-methyltransferase